MRQVAHQIQTKLAQVIGNWGWIIGGLATFFYVAPFGDREYYVNGDGLYFIWTGLIQSENLLGFSEHLAWPEGFSNWQYPQLGVGYLLIGSIASLIAPSSSASTIFGLSIVIIAMLNGISVNLLLRSIDTNFSYLRNCISFSLTFTPFLLTNTYHLSVAAFYPIVLSIYLFIRLSEEGQLLKFSWKEYIVLLVLLTGIPWWQGVITLIFLTMALSALLMKSKVQLKNASLIALINSIGFLLQTLPSLFIFGPNSLATRSAWDSNNFGGHFTDFLFASPFINILFPKFASRIELGISNEFNYTGVLGIVGFTILMATLLTNKVTRFGQLGLIVILFFTLGAFGNLQAAFAELLGAKTPLRTWSRLVIAITLIGVMLLFIKLQKRRLLGMFFGTLISILTVLDVMSVNQTWDYDLEEEKQVIRQLNERTEGQCPILQVPINSWPNPYVDSEGMTDETMYSSAIFYTLDKSFYWTYGHWTLGDSSSKNSNLKIIEDGMESNNPIEYLAQFYCAILVDDSVLANNLGPRPNKDVELAQEIRSKPNVSVGDRYSLYILEQSKEKKNISD